MKYIYLILILFGNLYPIYSNTELEKDLEFIEIKTKLDPAWKVYTKKNFLYLERREPVLVMPEGKTNIPQLKSEADEDKIARMKKYGMKMKPNLVYRFEKRWTVNDTIQSDIIKTEIENKIKSLPEKYKITHLIDEDLSKRGKIFYSPKTKRDKQRVKEYFQEKEKLEKKIPQVPDYHLSKFSLFLVSKKGVSNDYTEVYPESVTGEFIQVEKLLFKYRNKE